MSSTVVELGFVEKRASWKLKSKYFPSKVGGCPAWLSLNNLPNRSEILCRSCHQPLTFLLQVYAPILEIEEAFHRTIFLFMCRNGKCSKKGSNDNFVVFRNQLPRKNNFYSFEPPEMNEKTSSQPCAENFQSICAICGCRADLKCEKCSLKDYCCEDHRNCDWEWNHVHNCSESKSAAGAKKRKVLNNFLLAEFELVTESEDLTSQIPEKSDEEKMKEYAQYLQASNASKELQEMPIGDFNCLDKKDKIFNKFQKRMKLEPEQVLRYDRGGEPLWASSEDIPSEQNIPNCECGAKRIFEFQVMPQLLYYLSLEKAQDSASWGTLIIYTCSNSCKNGTDNYVKEVLWKQVFSDDLE